MGQSKSSQRVSTIKGNVDQISEKIRSGELSEDNRDRSHDILIDYVKELKFIHSRSLRASRIRKVEKLIIAALQDLATLEGTFKNVEPRLKAKSLQTLHDIEKDLRTLNESLTNQNLEAEKEVVSKYKKRISLIEDVDQEIGAKKNEVLDVAIYAYNELASEEKLKQVEQKHIQARVELRRFVGVSDSGSYKKQKEHLLQLKEEIYQVSDVSEKVVERKKYLLFNIDNNLAALDKKVQENEDRIKKQIPEEELASTSYTSNQNLLDKVVASYKEFERSFSANCSPNELGDVFRKLTELKIKIDQKVLVLENQIQDPYIQLVPVKENEESTSQEDSLPLPSSRSINRIKEIQKEVEDLQEQITNSTYTKECDLYKNCKKNLEDSKKELQNLSSYDDSEDHHLLAYSVSTFIDEMLYLLDKNLGHRRSTTGDVLIDIMSISTNVNELGSKIRQCDSATHDYNSVECDLLDYLYYLRKVSIPPSRSNVCQFRDYVLIQIESYLSNLEKIKRNGQSQRDSEGVLHCDL